MSSFSVAGFNALTLSDFETWWAAALRGYLSLRNKALPGSSAKRAARAFVCWKEQLSANENKEHNRVAALTNIKRSLMIVE
jgi:hypothetical protein